MSKTHKKLQQKADEMLELISPLAEFPGKHFKAANLLIVDMAEVGMDTAPLMERLYFLTEGWREKDTRSARERLQAIMKG
jgi:hypothetical protein